jgi:hypothetical protein
VAWEAATLCSKSVALLFDYKKNGKITSMEPTAESMLEAAEIIEKQHDL